MTNVHFCPNCGNGKWVLYEFDGEINAMCTDCFFEFELKDLKKVGE